MVASTHEDRQSHAAGACVHIAPANTTCEMPSCRAPTRWSRAARARSAARSSAAARPVVEREPHRGRAQLPQRQPHGRQRRADVARRRARRRSRTATSGPGTAIPRARSTDSAPIAAMVAAGDDRGQVVVAVEQAPRRRARRPRGRSRPPRSGRRPADAAGRQRVAQPAQPVLGGGAARRAGDDRRPAVPEVGQRAARAARRPRGCRARRESPSIAWRPTIAKRPPPGAIGGQLGAEPGVQPRVVVPAAGQHDRPHALAVQQRDVAALALRVAERVADRDQPRAVVGHAHRAERDLREVRVGDVVHDHADGRGRRARQRLRRPVRRRSRAWRPSAARARAAPPRPRASEPLTTRDAVASETSAWRATS